MNKFIQEFFVEVISISFFLNLKFRTPSWKQNCRNSHIYFRVKNIIFAKNGKSNMPIKSKRWEILKIKIMDFWQKFAIFRIHLAASFSTVTFTSKSSPAYSTMMRFTKTRNFPKIKVQLNEQIVVFEKQAWFFFSRSDITDGENCIFSAILFFFVKNLILWAKWYCSKIC